MPRPRVRFALPFLALTLASCGGQPAPERVRDGRASIAMRDFYLDPQSVRSEEGRLTFALSNRGRLPHNFRLTRRGQEVARTSALKPGERDEVTVKVRHGTYRMYCSIGNHQELGVYGTVVVR